MNSTYKNCPKCNSNSIVKNGKQYGRIRYKCKDCGKQFQNKIIKTRAAKSIIQKLTFKKRQYLKQD
jgi:transposase-like protein